MTVSVRPDEEAIAASLVDPHWRMRNLYWITDKDGRECRFRPWPEQEKLLGELWYRNLILKARQPWRFESQQRP